MLHRRKAVGRLAADAMGGRIGGEQFRVGFLDVDQLVHQLVKIVVTDGRVVLLIVKFAVILNLFPQLLRTLLCGLKIHSLASISALVAPLL